MIKLKCFIKIQIFCNKLWRLLTVHVDMKSVTYINNKPFLPFAYRRFWVKFKDQLYKLHEKLPERWL